MLFSLSLSLLSKVDIYFTNRCSLQHCRIFRVSRINCQTGRDMQIHLHALTGYFIFCRPESRNLNYSPVRIPLARKVSESFPVGIPLAKKVSDSFPVRRPLAKKLLESFPFRIPLVKKASQLEFR
uniref:Uncharacterized protein n=1 Tax=Cacopsylla melanoneura TaxID=428564 RepID=A0A8D9EBD0_9HEMI